MSGRRQCEFSAAVVRWLANRVNLRCTNPDCQAPTSGPATVGERAISVGVAAHITAAAPGGPRYDASLTDEQRSSFANGIWLCQTCSRRIDVDEAKYPENLLRTWKTNAERNALLQIGRPTAVTVGTLARVGRARRFGAEVQALIDDMPIDCSPIYDPKCDGPPTWFVNGYVLRFKAKKRDAFDCVFLDEIVATVHSCDPIPPMQKLFAVYPARSDLFFVEIDNPQSAASRDFTATLYYEDEPEEGISSRERVAMPLAFDDDRPSSVTVRVNAKSPGLYRISLKAVFSKDDIVESYTVVDNRPVVFEELDIDEDTRKVAFGVGR